MTTSMVPSWGDGGFDFGIETTRTWSGKLGKPPVLDGDITSANHSLVKDGWCWWYRKYAPRDTVLEGLEKQTRERARKACGLIRSRCRRGSGGNSNGRVGCSQTTQAKAPLNPMNRGA
jgi:hypothetical protein